MSRKICGFQSRKVAAFLAGLVTGVLIGGCSVFGSEEFVALGKRLGGEGQRMELVDATGTVRSEATFVSGDALGQRFTYKLANPPAEDFEGKLILTSTGKDTPDASPKTIKVSVKFVAAGSVPKVSLTGLGAISEESGGGQVVAYADNIEGILGFSREEGAHGFDAKMSVNGGEPTTIHLSCNEDVEMYMHHSDDIAAGDTVRLTIELDPEKAGEYEADVMEQTTTVE